MKLMFELCKEKANGLIPIQIVIRVDEQKSEKMRATVPKKAIGQVRVYDQI